MGSYIQVRRQTISITLSGAGWSTPQELKRLGGSGLLVRSVLRQITGANANSEIRIFHGPYTSSQNPATVPDEDLVYEETGITTSNSATDASSDTNITDAVGDVAYDTRPITAGVTVPTEQKMFASVKGDGAGTFKLSIYAKDVT